MKQITLDVPQGIGDIFWCHQRLMPHFDQINYNIACLDLNELSQRALAWPKLWPQVGQVQARLVQNWEYHRIIAMHHPVANLLDKTTGWYGLNYPLEQGIRLEDTDPHPVQWNVPIHSEHCAVPWQHYILVYVSGSLAYWSLDDWYDLVTLSKPDRPIVLVGAKYDGKVLRELEARLTQAGLQAWSCVDQPAVKVSDVIQKADFFLGYQSGLGILADNLQVQQLMMYFPHLTRLQYAWCQPDHAYTVFNAASMQQRPEAVAETLRTLLEDSAST